MLDIPFKRIGFILIAAFFLPTSICSAQTKQAAIIIDDFGGNVKGVESFLQAEIPITAAIMPFLEESTSQAELAHQNGLEIMIHLPLEPKKGKASWLGPNGITTDLSDDEINKRLNEALIRVPYARGLNNHMGSKAMEDERIVKLIVGFAKENNLYLVDSGTTPDSLMPEIAKTAGIPCFKRSIFIDDTLSSKNHVMTQLHSFMKLAQQQEMPIAIGHVGLKGNETFAAIRDSLSLFHNENINLVFPSAWAYPQMENEMNQLEKGVNDL